MDYLTICENSILKMTSHPKECFSKTNYRNLFNILLIQIKHLFLLVKYPDNWSNSGNLFNYLGNWLNLPPQSSVSPCGLNSLKKNKTSSSLFSLWIIISSLWSCKIKVFKMGKRSKLLKKFDVQIMPF